MNKWTLFDVHRVYREIDDCLVEGQHPRTRQGVVSSGLLFPIKFSQSLHLS